MPELALLTDRRYTGDSAAPDDWYLANLLHDDRLLQSALQERGLSCRRVDWASADLDLSQFRAAVFRTTWDYFERFNEFDAWLTRNASATQWINPLPLIRWNLDKHYLADLHNQGVPVVRSHFIDPGDDKPLSAHLEQLNWDEAVVKPCISGGAWLTYRVNRATATEVEVSISQHRKTLAFLLQPFQNMIQQQGEITLMAFDGIVSHAVRKIAKAGDFRVQDDHGGTVLPHDATSEEVALAEQAIAACEPRPSYARIDMIRDNSGQLAIMELECIEPELWIRVHPPSAQAFADAICKALCRREIELRM